MTQGKGTNATKEARDFLGKQGSYVDTEEINGGVLELDIDSGEKGGVARSMSRENRCGPKAAISPKRTGVR